MRMLKGYLQKLHVCLEKSRWVHLQEQPALLDFLLKTSRCSKNAANTRRCWSETQKVLWRQRHQTQGFATQDNEDQDAPQDMTWEEWRMKNKKRQWHPFIICITIIFLHCFTSTLYLFFTFSLIIWCNPGMREAHPPPTSFLVKVSLRVLGMKNHCWWAEKRETGKSFRDSFSILVRHYAVFSNTSLLVIEKEIKTW